MERSLGMKLLIGNKNYSSWSLRPWLLLRQAGIAFEEERLSFNEPRFHEQVRRYSPVGKVPVLVDGEQVIWDSLAIAEYVAETHPDKQLWPQDRAARAQARSICAEMHSGFSALRSRMPMNCELELRGVLFELEVMREVERVVAIWTGCRERALAEGPFLFGRFSVADAFYAPVVLRFLGYGVELPERAGQYARTIRELPAMEEWISAAKAEHDFVPADEPYRRGR